MCKEIEKITSVDFSPNSILIVSLSDIPQEAADEIKKRLEKVFGENRVVLINGQFNPKVVSVVDMVQHA